MNPLAGLALRAIRDPKFKALLVTLGPAAAKAAADLAKQGRWRQLAVLHADTLVDGTFMKVPLAGQPHWVVWSGAQPVGAYPTYEGDLEHAVRHVDLTKRERPQDLRVRTAKRELAESTRRLGEAVTSGTQRARQATAGRVGRRRTPR